MDSWIVKPDGLQRSAGAHTDCGFSVEKGALEERVRILNKLFAHLCKCVYIKNMDTVEIDELAGLLKALGEVNRLSLVCKLCECDTPQNAMCLCECCTVDASGVSRHLKVLTQEGILNVEKRGRERTYSLNRAYVASRLRGLAEKIESSQEDL